MNISDIDLGELDAEKDDNLLQYVVHLPVIEEVTNGSKWIIYGPKGSGKTVVRKLLENEADISISISVDEAVDLPAKGYSSPADLRNKITALLVVLILGKLYSDGLLEKGILEKAFASKTATFLKKFASGISVGVPFFKWSAKELFSSDGDQKADEILDSKNLEVIQEAIGDKLLYLLVDDLDLLLSTSDLQARRDALSEFVEAADNVQKKLLRDRVMSVVFLKTEVFNEIKRSSTEFDKLVKGETRVLWTASLLSEVIKKRLAWANKGELEGIEGIVSQGSSLEELIDRVNALSISGPRQALRLLDLAISEAKTKKQDTIGLEEIEAVEADFGADILDNYAAFYQSIYPDIQDVIDKALRDGPSKGAAEEFANRIKSEVLSDPGFKSAFNNKWPFRKTANALLETFYEVGAIGIRRDDKVHYSLIDGRSAFRKKDLIEVHPGLRAYLKTN